MEIVRPSESRMNIIREQGDNGNVSKMRGISSTNLVNKKDSVQVDLRIGSKQATTLFFPRES